MIARLLLFDRPDPCITSDPYTWGLSQGKREGCLGDRLKKKKNAWSFPQKKRNQPGEDFSLLSFVLCNTKENRAFVSWEGDQVVETWWLIKKKKKRTQKNPPDCKPCKSATALWEGQSIRYIADLSVTPATSAVNIAFDEMRRLTIFTIPKPCLIKFEIRSRTWARGDERDHVDKRYHLRDKGH